jgi:2'-5' RNA ligase
MSGRRLFVALPLPAAAAASISGIVEAVRGQPLADGAHDVRWVRLDGLHLTLRFLGPTRPDQEAATVAAVQRAARASAPIQAALGGAGTFPPQGRPRTLWVGIATGVEAIGALATIVGQELAGAGWPIDDRPFRAHLTLARADGIAAGRLVADRLVAAMGRRRIDLDLDRIGLFESVTGGGPARYVPVIEEGLGGASPTAGVYHPDDP